MGTTETKNYVLDFTDCNCPLGVHELIQQELALPEWYGKNYDALWDSITGIMYLPAHIKIKKSENKKLEPMMNKLVKIFKEAEEEGYLTIEVIL